LQNSLREFLRRYGGAEFTCFKFEPHRPCWRFYKVSANICALIEIARLIEDPCGGADEVLRRIRGE
jgi:hypothetical protein